MPRTKISKSSKRNREPDNREEKIQEFETSLEMMLNQVDTIGNEYITEISQAIMMIKNRTSRQLLQMKMGDFFALNLMKFSDYQPVDNETNLASRNYSANSQSSIFSGKKISNPNDEGYLTEDSTNSAAASSMNLPVILSASKLRLQQPQLHGRTPGPLSSARLLKRRSRSASNDYVMKSKPSNTPSIGRSVSTLEHASRSKMRTPIPAQRTKAFSADRSALKSKDDANTDGTRVVSPNNALIRWPKPGEYVVSKCGSPVLTQVMSSKYANVNIPVRDGVLSLRPKKLCDVSEDFIESLEPETLVQIKTLQASLNLIVDLATKVQK